MCFSIIKLGWNYSHVSVWFQPVPLGGPGGGRLSAAVYKCLCPHQFDIRCINKLHFKPISHLKCHQVNYDLAFDILKLKRAFKDLFLSLEGTTVCFNQGDQIGWIFNIWLLFTRVFLKFYLNKQFQNTVCCSYFSIQKQFDATIFDFQFELL